MLRLGIIGCGAIGTSIAMAVDQGKIRNCSLVALFDVDSKQAEKLLSKIKHRPQVARSFGEFLSIDSDLVAECASQQALKEYAEKVLESGRDMLVMSEGAFMDAEFYK